MRKACAIALVLLATPSAFAVERYHLTKECKFDLEQYCKQYKPPHQLKEVIACLQKNEKNLLPRCQDHYKESIW